MSSFMVLMYAYSSTRASNPISSPSSVAYDTSIGWQQTSQSSTYVCSGTDTSSTMEIVCQQ